MLCAVMLLGVLSACTTLEEGDKGMVINVYIATELFDFDPARHFNDDAMVKIYDLVYEGDVPCKNLEDIYRMFNIDHPDNFNGRSLSISDVVQINNETNGDPTFHFCDRVGFTEIHFEPELAQDARPKTMKVVFVEPGKLARQAEIPTTLSGMQNAVKGCIEAFYPFEEQVCIICNEEGKLNGMPLNRAVYSEEVITDLSYAELTSRFHDIESRRSGNHLTGYIVFSQDSFSEPYSEESRTYVVSSNNKAFQPNMGGYSIFGSALDGSDTNIRLECYMQAERGGENGWKIERCYLKESEREMIEIISGPFFICDCSGSNFGSLSEDQLKRYMEMFKKPEHFAHIDGELVAVPYIPRNSPER